MDLGRAPLDTFKDIDIGSGIASYIHQSRQFSTTEALRRFGPKWKSGKPSKPPANSENTQSKNVARPCSNLTGDQSNGTTEMMRTHDIADWQGNNSKDGQNSSPSVRFGSNKKRRRNWLRDQAQARRANSSSESIGSETQLSADVQWHDVELARVEVRPKESFSDPGNMTKRRVERLESSEKLFRVYGSDKGTLSRSRFGIEENEDLSWNSLIPQADETRSDGDMDPAPKFWLRHHLLDKLKAERGWGRHRDKNAPVDP